jgi:pimeloyl-ACP methyl ester carboxylesterase
MMVVRNLLAPIESALVPAGEILRRMSGLARPSRVSGTPAANYAAGLAYHERGAGQPILFLHGLTASRGVFDPVMDLLAADYRVIAVDLPGHGDSPALVRGEPLTPRAQAFAVGQFLDALGLDKAHVVGNSMGGWVALELAADNRATSVVALCPAGLWYPVLARNRAIELNRRLARSTGPVAEVLMNLAPLREMIFATALQRPYRIDSSMAKTVVSAQRAARGYDEAHDGLLHHAFDRGAFIPTSTPVTIAFGDGDPLLPPHTCQLRHLGPDHAQWVTLDRVGHAPMWEDPERTVELIAGAVQESRSLSGASR